MIPRSTPPGTTARALTGIRSIDMTTSTRNRHASTRACILAIGLLLASVFATGPVSAGPLSPAFEIGAPGGGGGAAAQSVDLASSTIPGIRVD